MIKYFLKLFIRNLNRNRLYSVINILSLAVGLAAFILISLYIQYEYSWDKSYKDHERIYRLDMQQSIGGDAYIPRTAALMGKKLNDLYPDIEKNGFLRFIGSAYLSSSEKLTFYEGNGYFADSCFTDVLSLEFLEGELKSALNQPFTIVLTKALADKYFPEGNALGKIMRLRNMHNLKVSAVINDFPENSHFNIDYLVTMESQYDIEGWDGLNFWQGFNFFTYLKLKEGANAAAFEKKIENIMAEYYTTASFMVQPRLKPIAEIHLNPGTSSETQYMIYLFAGLAFFVLLLTCINFSNLTTANASLRSKEIGLKKTFGSQRSQLMKQFLIESLIITFIALQISYIITELSLSTFNNLIHRELSVEYFNNWELIIFTVIVTIISALFAGFHPAVVLSAMRPILAMKGNTQGSKKNAFRNGLVIMQFVISIVFTISTIYIFKQINYYSNKDLGFKKENLLVVRISQPVDFNDYFLPLKTALLSHPNIENAAISSSIPFHGYGDRSVNYEGGDPNKRINMRTNWVGYDYNKTFGMEIIQGRDFSDDFSEDIKNKCIINEAAARAIGWDNPVGKKIWNDSLTIIGVVKDFHSSSLFNTIMPAYSVMHKGGLSGGNFYTIRISENANIKNIKADINDIFNSYMPNAIFEIKILENELIENDLNYFKNMGRISLLFSVLAIIIASLGMFGLVSFTVKRRMKEIGIRKALGALSQQIFQLLLKTYLRLLLIAIIISIPIGYYLISLNTSTYKPAIEIWEFLLSIIIALLLVLVTAGYHTMKAARANAIDSLKYE